MRFWDASAVVPLLISETSSARLRATLSADPGMLVWWGTGVECASALARLEREGHLTEAALNAAFDRLRQFEQAWHTVEPTDAVKDGAIRAVRVHPLRAANSLQLAAAVVAASGRPASLEMVTLDDRLASAARREGLKVVDRA